MYKKYIEMRKEIWLPLKTYGDRVVMTNLVFYRGYTAPFLFLNLQKGSLSWKHVTHYGPRSGFLYYTLTIAHRDDFPYQTSILLPWQSPIEMTSHIRLLYYTLTIPHRDDFPYQTPGDALSNSVFEPREPSPAPRRKFSIFTNTMKGKLKIIWI